MPSGCATRKVKSLLIVTMGPYSRCKRISSPSGFRSAEINRRKNGPGGPGGLASPDCDTAGLLFMGEFNSSPGAALCPFIPAPTLNDILCLDAGPGKKPGDERSLG